MTLEAFNHVTEAEKKILLTQCCGSGKWVNIMLGIFPAATVEEVLASAEMKWKECSKEDWLEAFEHHPKIGDIGSLKEKFANTKQWASGEQSGVNGAGDQLLHNLAQANKDYENKFGFIFIVCATGKSADEMLSILLSRLPNELDVEIEIAAEEQNKITQLRLQKLFAET